MGPHKIDRSRWDWDEIARNPFFCPDPEAARLFEAFLDGVRKSGSSVGAVLEVVAEGVPPGWGAPIYGKLDAELAAALMSINAVKGVEFGNGFAAAELSGEDNADEIRRGPDGQPDFPVEPCRRHSGRDFERPAGGGAFRRETHLLDPGRTPNGDRSGEETEIVTKGRHDPCVGIRAVPVGEAMVACVLADHFLRHRAQVGKAARLPVRDGLGRVSAVPVGEPKALA